MNRLTIVNGCKILAIDTATDACSAAILTDGVVFEKNVITPQQHARNILLIINELLGESDLKLNNLDAVAFGCGPGSFTGVRLAVSVIHGLAFGAGLPVIPVSSLAAIAQQAYRKFGFENVVVAQDARMQEVYLGTYRLNVHGFMEAVVADRLVKPVELLLPIDDKIIWHGVGDAWVLHENIASNPANMLMYPQAQDIALLATFAYKQQQTLAPEIALPQYLRGV